MINSLGRGGAEKALIDILKNIDYGKFKIFLIVVRHERGYEDQVPKQVKTFTMFGDHNNHTVNRIEWSFAYRLIKYAPQLVYRYLRGKYKVLMESDLLVSFLEGPSTKMVSYFDKPKIAWMHTDYLKNHWVSNFFKSKLEERDCYNNFNKIVFVSNQGRKSFNSFFDNEVTAPKEVIYNPIDTNSIKSLSLSRDPFFEDWIQRNEKKVRLVSVGRLNPVKQFPWLLKLQKHLEDNGVNTSLTIIGEGREQKNLDRIIKNKQIDNVELLGFKNNPYPYVKNSDLYLAPSRAESYPLSIAEAFVLGIPVLATRNSGSRELSRDGEFALLSAMDVKDFISKADELCISTEKRQYWKLMANKGANTFSMYKVITKIENLFESTLN